MIFPHSRLDPLVTITPFSFESLGSTIGMMGNGINGTASFAWVGANTALFFPFFVNRRITVQQLLIMNGATVSGNVDMGIYSADGTRIVSAGSTAQTGTSAIQALPITATELTASQYYLAAAINNITATVYRANLNFTGVSRWSGIAQMTSAFPLPATATFAAATTGNSDYVPLIALTTRTVI